jgi:hypothetical protein
VVARLLLPLLVVLVAAPALAHRERQILSPPRPGPVPDLNRKHAKTLVVCKASSKPSKAAWKEIQQRLKTATGDALASAKADEAAWRRNNKLFAKCRYEHVQEAVNAAGNDTLILVLPGVYREEPSRAFPKTSCGDNPDCSYSYEYHVAHPHDANLVAVLGKKNVTIEGTGVDPHDVLIDAGFAKDVVIRADRADGIIVRNLWARDANEHGIYFVETDGYVFDRTIGSFSRDYELFSFASDNGLYQDCEALGGSDSGIYVGGAPDTSPLGRFSAVIRRCKMHHNALGFSGTQGTSVQITECEVTDNAIGLSFNSQNDHPNFPQRRSQVDHNDIHHNNFDIYAATSDVPPGGPARDFFHYPIGAGVWIIGGEDNVVRDNRIHDNQVYGAVLAGNGLEAPIPAEVHRNQYVGNLMGADAGNGAGPNGLGFPPGGDFAPGGGDFFWDETGNDNCWGPNGTSFTSSPSPIPGPCPAPNTGAVIFPPPEKLALLLSCTMEQIPGSDPPEFRTADTFYPCPFGQLNHAPDLNRDQAECGNGVIDLGEDCDPGVASNFGGDGYSYRGTAAVAETCATLGHGTGILACRPDCIWDTSGCTAAACQEYGGSRTRIRIDGPVDASNTSRAYPVKAGQAFDPLTEEVSLVLRDQEGAVMQQTIPAGDPGWKHTAGGWVYQRPGGTLSHDVELVKLYDLTPTRFRTRWRATPASLTPVENAQTLDAILRIGDDCWADSSSCVVTGNGDLICRGRSSP